MNMTVLNQSSKSFNIIVPGSSLGNRNRIQEYKANTGSISQLATKDTSVATENNDLKYESETERCELPCHAC